MPSTAHRSGASTVTRTARVPAAARRLAWISVILGLISLDLDALTLLSPLAPLRWYIDLLLLYGSATVVTLAMLALGGPLALLGLLVAGNTLRRGRAPFATLLGIALCSISLAMPLAYAVFLYTFFRGLL
jgi:hypothetical protein